MEFGGPLADGVFPQTPDGVSRRRSLLFREKGEERRRKKAYSSSPLPPNFCCSVDSCLLSWKSKSCLWDLRWSLEEDLVLEDEW